MTLFKQPDAPVNENSQKSGPMTGIRIIDMTSIGMGPFATQNLGDMGADVIKVESAGGDIFRHVTPQRHAGMSHAFLNINRNKRSIVLDARTEHGKEAILRLVATADVFISNIRSDSLARLGLDYESLRAVNARLVFCNCYGYSEAGPYGGRASLDDVIQAACGMAHFEGIGQPAPRFANTAAVDKVCGLYITNAISMALFARERSGKGQAIEVPMFECMVSFMLLEHLSGLTFEPPEGPPGYARLLNKFRKPYKSLDGYISVVPYTDEQWQRFFLLAGRPDLAESPQYKTQFERSSRFAEVYGIVEQLVAQRSNAEWIALLGDADVPYSPVNSVEDLLADPHLNATGYWHHVDHPTEGKLTMTGIPVHFSDTPGTIRRLAPNLGEHTAEILAEIGMTPAAAS